jgi:hypothetical protein
MLKMRNLIGLVLIAVVSLGNSEIQSQPPPPAPSKASHKPEANPAQHNETSAKDQRGTEPSPLFIKVIPSTTVEPEPSKEHEKTRDYTSSEWWLIYLTGALSFITLILALYTGKLYRATVALGKEAKTTSDRQAGEMRETLNIARETAKASRDAADVAHDAMIAGERAFVFPGKFNFWYRPIANGEKRYYFQLVWENCGDTPTKKLTTHIRFNLRDEQLPEDFDFRSVVSDRLEGDRAEIQRCQGFHEHSRC